jgi:ribosomal protein L23
MNLSKINIASYINKFKIYASDNELNKRITEVLTLTQELVNEELFEYLDDAGAVEILNELNRYIKEGFLILNTSTNYHVNSEFKDNINLDFGIDNIIEHIETKNIGKKPPTTKPTYQSSEFKKAILNENTTENTQNTDITNILGKKKHIPELKNTATTKPTYINRIIAEKSRGEYRLNEQDKNIIIDINLPENKVYIYKELKQLFGKNIKTGLYRYGVNRFCRMLEDKYPDGYKKTEIKNVINRIFDFETIKKRNYEKIN